MGRPNDDCTSTTCALARFNVRHYRWQCGSDLLEDGPSFGQRAAHTIGRLRDELARLRKP